MSWIWATTAAVLHLRPQCARVRFQMGAHIAQQMCETRGCIKPRAHADHDFRIIVADLMGACQNTARIVFV